MKLNKKLSAFGLLISMLLMSVTAGAAVTGVTVTNGSVDRAFDAGRTLYNVYVPAGTAPQFTATGGTVTTEVANGVATVTDNETGIKYRFVINELPSGEFKINRISLSITGNVTINLSTSENLNVIVTKPKALGSMEAYTLNDISGTDQESKILRQFIIPAGSTTYSFQMPATAISGTYKFIFAVDNQYKSKVESKDVYFTTPAEFDAIRTDFNAAKGLEDVTVEGVTTPGINSIISANYFKLNVDLAEYNALEDKSLFASFLLDKNFTDNQDMIDAVTESLAVSLVNDATSETLIQAVEDNNSVIGFDFTAEFAEVENTAALTELMKGIKFTSAADVVEKLNKYIALQRVNEADPMKIEVLFDNYKTELEIPQTTVDLYNLLGTTFKQEALKGAISLTGYKTHDDFNAVLLNSITLQAEAQAAAQGTQPGDGNYVGGGNVGGVAGGSTTGTVADGSYDFGTDINATDHEKEPDYEKPTLEEVRAVFTDLDNHEWAHEAIMLLYDWDVISGKGDGIFDPDGAVTREEFVKMLMLAISVNDKATELPFTDVNENDWFYNTVSFAYKAGITTGVTDTEFGVGLPIIRQDMAVMLNKAMSVAKISIDANDVVTFTDHDQIADYAKKAVEALANRGLLKGSGDGSFEPNATVTRAVAAQAIYNLIKNV